MRYRTPGTAGSLVDVEPYYGDFIGGTWRAPRSAAYRTDPCPATGEPICEVPRSGPADVADALAAAGAAAEGWARRPAQPRADVLDAVAAAIDAHHGALAIAESWDSGLPVRESRAADVPLAADRFRHFAAILRTGDGGARIDADPASYRFHALRTPVGRVVSLDSPQLTAAWDLAPVLASGRCAILAPAACAPWAILKLAEVIGGAVPPGVINIVNLAEADFSAVNHLGEHRVCAVASGPAGDRGGRVDIVFADVVDDDDLLDRTLDSVTAFAFNRGRAAARALIQEAAFEPIIERVLERVRGFRQGDPLDTETLIGPLSSAEQVDELASRVRIGRADGAVALAGGRRARLGGALRHGYFYEPTVLRCGASTRTFAQGVSGPVLAVAAFETEAEAARIAGDIPDRAEFGIWTRERERAHRMGRHAPAQYSAPSLSR